MTSNRWIENSRNFFALLLNLYPRDYRDDYAFCMQQVFTDQCRSTYKEKGILGIIRLWLRVLPDLGYTAVLEHFSSPRAAWGLMEPVPNAPLPWKGVFMILLPGLVYLVSQIAQLTGQPWYLAVYYRAAFLLIIPVLVVWAITRRFPIWGLIPVGLLYRLVQEIGYQLVTLHPDVFSSNVLLNAILNIAKGIEANPFIVTGLFLVAIVYLTGRYLKSHKTSRWFWIWGGSYLLLAILQKTFIQFSWIFSVSQNNAYIFPPDEILGMLISAFGWDLFNITAFLLLIFIGTLFTRRHGFFTILILVGYILPTMLVGIPYGLEELPNQIEILVLISAGVLVYRALLSLIAPIWMSRSSSQIGKKRAVIFSIAIALAVHAVMQFYPVLFPLTYAQINSDWIVTVLLDEFRLVSAFLLAMVMYQDASQLPSTPEQSIGVLPEAVSEKA
jgi:hypothetical protein